MMLKDQFSNEELARLFRGMAAAHEVRGENAFTIKAYQNAADSVEKATSLVKDLWEEGRLKEVAGIGKNLNSYLDEYFKTGKVKHFEATKKGLPGGMFEILGLPHVGSKTAYKLAKHFGLKEGSTVARLKELCQQGRIRTLEGFGEKSEKEILEGILRRSRQNATSRLSLPLAYRVSQNVLDYLKSNSSFQKADVLGSLRRFTATVGDVDIAVASDKKDAIIKHFLAYPQVKKVLWFGKSKATVLLKNGIQVDLMVEKTESYGSLPQHFTGSKSHNIQLRELALKKGLSLSEHGIKVLGKPKSLKFASEKGFYKFLGLPIVPPEIREGNEEIEAALKGNLPSLVEVSDIKGDLQVHSNWSLDGVNSIEEIVSYSQKKGYRYVGITDHQLSFEALGSDMTEAGIRRRKEVIDKIDYSNSNLRVLNGIGLLIKSNGHLSYPDYLLKLFDYVLVSIHSGFTQNREQNTKRIIQALKNNFVTALAHPTTRLINKREEIEAGWEEIFRFCAIENKLMEIDGAPERMDLPDILVRQAKSLGVKFLVDTDAHRIEQLDNMVFGVSVARRGWLTKKEVINTYPFDKLKEVLRMK